MKNIQESTTTQPLHLHCVGTLQASAAGNRYLARFIQAGRVRARGGGDAPIEIAASALQQAAVAGLFDQRAIFLDHAGWLEHPSLAQLIGLTGFALYDSENQSVEGEISFLDNSAARHALSIIQAYLQNPNLDIGLSLVFYPEWETLPEPGRNGQAHHEVQRIAAIRSIESIDLVFQPAAGGRILQPLSQPDHPSQSVEGENLTMQPNTTPSQTTVHEVNPAQVEMPRIQTSMLETPRRGVSTDPGVSPTEKQVLTTKGVANKQGIESTLIVEPQQDNHRAAAPAGNLTDGKNESEPWLNAVRQATTEAMLAASGLPAVSQQRLAAQLYQTPSAIQQAIEAERSYLASLSENQVIQLPGERRVHPSSAVCARPWSASSWPWTPC